MRAARNRFLTMMASATLIAILFLPRLALASSIAVVAHPDVPIDDITFTELKKVLRGDREFWSSGNPVTLIVRAPVAAERTLLLNSVYEMSESQFRQYWISKVFRAEAVAEPRIVLSSDETAELLTIITGAVGLMRADEVPQGLKILRVDGKNPGDPGYPLVE
jgi:hypothetical protein